MKKKLARALALGLTTCIVSSSAAFAADYSGQWIRNTSSSMGGIWYPMAVAMDLIWEESLPGIATKVVTGSSAENVRLVANGETEIGWCHSVAIVDALNGNAPYDDGGDYTTINHIATIHPAAIHCYAYKDSGIETLADLNGKNVAVPSAGSTAATAVINFLEQEYGITEETITEAGGLLVYGSNSDSITMMQDHQIDVFFSQSTYPSSDIAEMESDLKLVSFGDEQVDDFVAKSGQWLVNTIPGGTYTNNPDDYKTISSYVMIACPASMDEELVYQMTKSMWENLDKIQEASADAKAFMSLDIATVCKDIVPLHPGAERYYKEIGVLTEE